MPSRLGGFTSKSNKCNDVCFTKAQVLKYSRRESHSTIIWISHKSYKPGLEMSLDCWLHQHPPKEGEEAPFIAGYGKLAIGRLEIRTSLTQGQTSLAEILISTVGMKPGLVRLTGRTSPIGPERFLLK
jgi:hypothetical protein